MMNIKIFEKFLVPADFLNVCISYWKQTLTWYKSTFQRVILKWRVFCPRPRLVVAGLASDSWMAATASRKRGNGVQCTHVTSYYILSQFVVTLHNGNVTGCISQWQRGVTNIVLALSLPSVHYTTITVTFKKNVTNYLQYLLSTTLNSIYQSLPL